MPSLRLPGSTLEGLQTEAGDRAARWGRRAFLSLVLLLVGLGLSGVLGVHATTHRAQEGDWQVSLRYAATARAGLDVPWQVTVRHRGGFDGPVVIAVSGAYFDIYETQGFHPEPSASRRDARSLYLEFDPPPSGEVLVIAYDAYIQPSSQVGEAGTVGVWEAGRVVAPVDFDTRLLP